MRPVRTLELKVGLLVVAGLTAAFALLMSADRLRLERNYLVTAWLKDAGGLRLASPVTLAGISVGTVTSIGNDPSGRIKAELSIHEGIRLPSGVKAKLVSSGLFGDSSLAFAQIGPATASNLPSDGSAEIDVSPGFFDEASARADGILTGVADLLNESNRTEVARLLKSSADLATHAATVAARLDAQGARLDAMLANLETTSAKLASATTTLDARLGPLLEQVATTITRLDAGAGDALERLAAVATRADALLADNGPRITAMLQGLSEAAIAAAAVTEAIREGRGVVGQLVMSRELATTVADLATDAGSVARAVADRPSAVVFDDDATIAAEKARREREKMRRAMAAGPADQSP